MKLSQVLSYRSRMVQMLANQDHAHACDLHSAHVMSVFDPGNPGGDVWNQHVQHSLEDMSQSINRVRTTISDAIDHLDTIRVSLNNDYLRRSEELYLQFMHNGQACLSTINFDIRNYWPHQLAITPDEESMLLTRLAAYNDWHLPGMILGAGMHKFVDSLVGMDPLYLVDVDNRLLRPVISRFPPVYQNRLRPYTTKETRNDPLHDLPNNQFGLVFIYDFFTYRPLRLIESYLKDIMAKLRPGGRIAMTINDCDHAESVYRTEQSIACYTPGHLVETIWNTVGFNKNYDYTSDAGWRYIELQRPGTLTSLRGGQSLAKIKPKH